MLQFPLQIIKSAEFLFTVDNYAGDIFLSRNGA